MKENPALLMLGLAGLVWHLGVLVDVLRWPRSGRAKLGWFLFIVALPPFGGLSYWIWGIRSRGRKNYGPQLMPLFLSALVVATVAAALGFALMENLFGKHFYLNWLAAWGAVTFMTYAYDKFASMKQGEAGSARVSRRVPAGRRRVPELTLHILGLVGGFVGGWLAMYLLRHKTRKVEFALVLAVATALHVSKVVGYW